MAWVAIVLQLAWFSRLVLLSGAPIATLGAGSGLVCLLFAPTALRGRGVAADALLVLASLGLAALWLVRFEVNTGLEGDPRSIANIGGIVAFFPFLYLVHRRGVTATARLFGRACLAYAAIYVAASLAVIVGGFGTTDNSVILQDPARGRRVYADAALLAFALYGAAADLRQGRGGVRALLALAVTLAAIALAQSRVAILLYAIGLTSIVAGAPGVRRWIERGYLVAFALAAVVALFASPVIAALLERFEDPSLSLRLLSLGIARDLFAEHPLLGIGLPGDAAFLPRRLGLPYYPQDLGILGLLGSYGLVGLAWVVVLIARVVRAGGLAAREGGPAGTALAHLATYAITTTAFSQNLFEGDGGVVLGLLLAVGADPASRRGERPAPPGSATAPE